MTICNMKTILDWNHKVIEDKVKHQIYAVCAIFPGNGFAWYESSTANGCQPNYPT
jgi:hypothetical protein